MTDILSIQSAVAYGHVGNSAAVFPLQRLGFNVWPVDTVQFSNHTGYGAWRGHVTEPAQIDEIVKGIGERGALARIGAVLSGYLGNAETGQAVLRAVSAVRRAGDGALYLCDPVMGDDGRGFFVRPGIPEFFAGAALPEADIVTPNRFELAFLADREVDDLGSALEAAAILRARGPKIVVTTSLRLPDHDGLAILADGTEGAWLARTPLLPVNLNGTGDAFSALFLGNYLRTDSVSAALERTVAAMYAVIEATWKAGARELRLVLTQDELAEPTRSFPAERVR